MEGCAGPQQGWAVMFAPSSLVRSRGPTLAGSACPRPARQVPNQLRWSCAPGSTAAGHGQAGLTVAVRGDAAPSRDPPRCAQGWRCRAWCCGSMVPLPAARPGVPFAVTGSQAWLGPDHKSLQCQRAPLLPRPRVRHPHMRPPALAQPCAPAWRSCLGSQDLCGIPSRSCRHAQSRIPAPCSPASMRRGL